MSLILEHYSTNDLIARTSLREGEIKLGQCLHTINEDEWNSETPLRYRFVIVGIEEDLGVRANLGRGGAQHAFQAFLKHLCNMQENRFFPIDDIALLGALINPNVETDDLSVLRKQVADADQLVTEVVEKIRKRGAIPIVVGGGHNNSYGCLKGTSLAVGQAVSCLNIDAHTDLRSLEGRHSGNGFSYAKEEGYLGHYFMLGIQENYTPEYVWQYIEDHEDIDLMSYEDFLAGEESLDEVYVRLQEHLGSQFGLELDVDTIANFPSSAQSISGFSMGQIREMIYALDFEPLYFHICEGRPTTEYEFTQVGRGLALLVADFIKAHIYDHE